ncbi:MAG TPA: GTP-binding protein, partial [Methanomassiliicoccales archaeon]|nr:GTP-binding protein [Methanomassiliicoccales archaeon]
TLYNTFKPDIVIVEPSGVAIPWGLKRAAEYSEEEMEAKIEHAPVVTLVDAIRIEDLLGSVRRLVETQVREADVVFINKVDSASPEKVKKAEDFVRGVNPTAKIMYGSGRNGQGVKEIATLIERDLSPRYDEAVEKELLRKSYVEGQ